MIILTHIGLVIPEYIETFLIQLRKFNPDIKVVFLVNNINLNNNIFLDNKIETFPIEELDKRLLNEFIRLFGYGDIDSSSRDIIYGSSDYWCVTATRLFYLYEYIKLFNINNFFHFENDIMIYEDLKFMENNIFSKLDINNKIFITRGSNNKIMTGFMFVSNKDVLLDIISNFIIYLKNNLKVGDYGIDMINEMALLHIYQILNPTKLIELPILPEGNFSKDIETFQSLFDPATYGQYLDGIPSNPGVSIITDSYIGDFIKNNSPDIVFEFIDNKKIPFLIYNGFKIKINNLHIHSKRLRLFNS